MNGTGSVRRGGVIAVSVLAAAAVLWLIYQGLTWDLRRGGEEPAAAFRPVHVVRGDLRETVAASGTMESVTRVEIKSEVSGVVRKISVEEGDRVTRGQPLVELDLDRLADRVDELRAALEVRRAEARQDVVARAAADLAQARRDYRRVAHLFAQGVASEQDRDDARHALRLAEIAGGDAEALQAARDAAVSQAEAALQRAERDLANGVLRAPIDGVVIRREAELGTPVADMSASNGGTLVAVVADDRHLRLVAQIDENDIADVAAGQEADVRIDALPEETVHGTVRKVSSAGMLDEKIASFEVEIELPPDPRVRVGMSADARVVVATHRDVLLIPNTAIVRGAGGPQVLVSGADGRGGGALASIREGYSDGFLTVVAEGLEEGDAVLVRGDGAGR